MSKRWILLGAVAVVMAVGGSPAWATVVDSGKFSGTSESSSDECGFVLDTVSTFSGTFRVRADRGGEAFYARDTFRYRDVLTNPETGEWFVVAGHGTFNEVRARLVEGDIYEFVAVESGQPFTIRDSDGNVVVRDRGAIIHTALFDTLGDGQPGGEFLEETAVVHGPHLGFDEDFDFCAIAAELTGA